MLRLLESVMTMTEGRWAHLLDLSWRLSLLTLASRGYLKRRVVPAYDSKVRLRSFTGFVE